MKMYQIPLLPTFGDISTSVSSPLDLGAATTITQPTLHYWSVRSRLLQFVLLCQPINFLKYNEQIHTLIFNIPLIFHIKFTYWSDIIIWYRAGQRLEAYEVKQHPTQENLKYWKPRSVALPQNRLKIYATFIMAILRISVFPWGYSEDSDRPARMVCVLAIRMEYDGRFQGSRLSFTIFKVIFVCQQ